MPNYIYKYYKDNALVYIGRTSNNPHTRWRQHALASEKFENITRIELCELETLTDAMLTEIMLISKHKPRWNTEFVTSGDSTFAFPEMQFDSYELMDFCATFSGGIDRQYGRKKSAVRRKQITTGIEEPLLKALDNYCEKNKRMRNSAINIAVERFLIQEGELKKGGKK